MSPEILALIFFITTFALIFWGYPVAFVLGGNAFLFFLIGYFGGYLNFSLFELMPNRIYGIMNNKLLLAIPYFVFMGNILQESRLAHDMLETIGKAFGGFKGGLGITVILVGALMAASTSIVAASVIAMGVISLPVMLENGYSKEYATGVIVASGTLGQIIPPSIVLIILADQMGVSVGDLFKGALMPGLLLTSLYIIYTILLGIFQPNKVPSIKDEEFQNFSSFELLTVLFKNSLPPLVLIVLVLGSIFMGVATPTEAGAVGASGAIILALIKKRINWKGIYDAAKATVETVGMVLFLLIGATAFALIFRAYGGDTYLEHFLTDIPGGKLGLILFSSIFIFLLGFFIDFFEIVFIVIPLIVPAAIALEIDLVWFGIILSMNMQTSFLTPPFGFSLFFLKSVSPPEIETKDIYKGVIPFVILQVICMIIVYLVPDIVTW